METEILSLMVDCQGNPLSTRMQGKTVQVDHVEDTLTITVSSLGGLSAGQIKDLLQKRFKVVGMIDHKRVTFVK